MSERDKILKTEFSEEFVEGMKDRMVTSFFKYGQIRAGFPHKVNALKSAQLCIDKYKEDFNTEHLIDASNYLMIEYILPSLENAYFKATDSEGSVGRKWYNGGATKRRNDE